jgi:hypothetical protein
MAILAAISVPFVKGYISDAANDRAKTQLYKVYNARNNFMSDHPGLNPNTGPGLPVGSFSAASNSCFETLESRLDSPGVGVHTPIDTKVLLYCNYLDNNDPMWNTNYIYFPYRTSTCCQEAYTDNAAACMKGGQGSNPDAKYGASYCAWIDRNGTLKENGND